MTDLIWSIPAGIFFGLFVVAVWKGHDKIDKELSAEEQMRDGYYFRKKMLIDKIHRKGIMVASDGRSLLELSVEELESEYRKLCEIGG